MALETSSELLQSGTDWAWGEFYQLLDVVWAEDAPAQPLQSISPAICRIDRLLTSAVDYSSSSLQLTFSVPRGDADIAFAECQVFRPTSAASSFYQAEQKILKTCAARHYPGTIRYMLLKV